MTHPITWLRDFWRRKLIGIHTIYLIGKSSAPAMRSAGLLESPRRGVLWWAYRLGFWLVVALVAWIPTSPDRGPFYFPAIFGFAVAWMLAMPAYGGILSSRADAIDFSKFRPASGYFAWLMLEVDRRVKLPLDLSDRAGLLKESAELSGSYPALMPGAVMAMIHWLMWRALGAVLFALSGMIAGPWLSSIHIAPLRGWSPVAVLYGLTVPPVLLMLAWIAILVGGYTYLVNARVQLTRDSPPDEGGDPQG